LQFLQGKFSSCSVSEMFWNVHQLL
jgi:hypothetical protein